METAETVETVETVDTVDTVEIVKIVETLETVETVETIKNIGPLPGPLRQAGGQDCVPGVEVRVVQILPRNIHG